MINLSEVIIQPAASEDFDQVVKLLEHISSSIKERPDWDAYQVKTSLTKQKQIFQEIIGGSGVILTARLHQQMIGVLHLEYVRNLRHGWKRAHLEEVVVHPAYQRRGVGTKMLTEIVIFCRKNDIKVIKLMSGKQLIEASAFYTKFGFKNLDHGLRLGIEL